MSQFVIVDVQWKKWDEWLLSFSAMTKKNNDSRTFVFEKSISFTETINTKPFHVQSFTNQKQLNIFRECFATYYLWYLNVYGDLSYT